ncbi:MAG TPA: TRAP transporter substrate-binding protein DctP [Bradyrhizobium sp.]|nr:TRAP transporter substrate-binding protein DctP [Bradyrhizobium sp.]
MSSRYELLRAVVALVLFSVAGGLTGANAQQIYELKASVYTPPSNPLARAMEQWASIIKDKSKGRLIIKVFPGGQMGPPPRQFDLVRSGVADLAIVLHGLTPGRFPLTELAHVPGVLPSNGYVSSLALSDVWANLSKSDHPGVKVLNVLAIIPMPIISRTELTKWADLRGKRVRAAGSVQSDVLQAMGAVPILVQPGDLNDALDKGMIEAASIGYSGIASYHLTDAGKFVSEGELGGVTFATVMNESAFKKLPGDLQKLLDESSRGEGARLFARILAEDESAYRAKLNAQGIRVSTLSSDASLQDATIKIKADAIKRAKAAGFDAEGVLAKLRAALEKYKNAK